MRNLLPRFASLAALLLLVCSWTREVTAQELIGGPYVVDSATVVLLHFDGTTLEEVLTNESDQTDDPIPYGNVTFLQENPLGDEMGSFLYLDNNAQEDSSFLTIPDTDALDLTESWTMEAWVYILTYGDTNEDWRWRPKVLVKPGDEDLTQSNYYNVLRGDGQFFNTGYYSPSGGGYIDIWSPTNSFQPGNWYHVVFIRDHDNSMILQAVHNQDRELLHFYVEEYDPILADPPATTDKPAYIGINLGQDGGWLDGFLDELRISNVVRPFALPPVITQVKEFDNQSTEGPFEVTAKVRTIGDVPVESVILHYDIGAGLQEVSMTNVSGDTYSASIPSVDFGTVVEYYISAQVNQDLRSTAPSTAEDDTPIRYRFAVVNAESHVLHLDFEEGGGEIQNKGDLAFTFIQGGQPEYVQGDAAAGAYALRFDGQSYLEVPADEGVFLASSQFVIDLSFKADSLPDNGTRLIIHEGADAWNNYNYHIWSSGGGKITPASFYPGYGRNGAMVGPDSTIQPDRWYRVVYVVDQDTTFTRLYDENNEIIQEKGGVTPGAIHISSGPFHIGGHSPAILDGNSDGVPDGPLFRGLMDEIHFYNYVPEEYQPVRVGTKAEELPAKVRLAQNYPNPFNPRTTIQYTLPRSMHVNLALFDILGRKVMTIVDDVVGAGTHSVELDGSTLASGLYLYRLQTEDATRARQMLLLK